MDQKVLVGTTDGLYEVGGGQPIQKAAAGHEVTSLAKGDSGWWAIIDRREVWHSAHRILFACFSPPSLYILPDAHTLQARHPRS